MPLKERSVGFAMNSVKSVQEHEKFKQIFAEYADAIGITKQEILPEWIEHKKMLEEKEAKKKAAEEEKRRKEEEAAQAVQRELEKKAIAQYFKLLRDKNLTKYIGQPKHAKKLMKNLMAWADKHPIIDPLYLNWLTYQTLISILNSLQN